MEKDNQTIINGSTENNNNPIRKEPNIFIVILQFIHNIIGMVLNKALWFFFSLFSIYIERCQNRKYFCDW